MAFEIEENIPLSRYTSLHVGGPARYFARIKSLSDLQEALRFAHSEKIPFRVLGQGSNVLFPDTGYPGLLLHMENREITVEGRRLTAGSGVFMRRLIGAAHEHGLVGLEELAGIPGTVGGAVRGNAGTWSTETGDRIVFVTVVTSADPEPRVIEMPAADCGFVYRGSVFKTDHSLIVFSATFELVPGDIEAATKLVAKDLHDRHERQPYDAPSAGSIFKNPDKEAGVYAGALIEAAGLKGFKIGGAEISEKHANFIVNRGEATATDILSLIREAQRKVEAESGILLEPEIDIIASP